MPGDAGPDLNARKDRAVADDPVPSPVFDFEGDLLGGCVERLCGSSVPAATGGTAAVCRCVAFWPNTDMRGRR
jgi:hypothetical protein